jgi:hypothetical protein
MTNPDFGGPPGTNPPRHRRDDQGIGIWAWVLSLAGVIVVLFLVMSLSSFNQNPKVSGNPAATTTGQGGTPPPAPRQ